MFVKFEFGLEIHTSRMFRRRSAGSGGRGITYAPLWTLMLALVGVWGQNPLWQKSFRNFEAVNELDEVMVVQEWDDQVSKTLLVHRRSGDVLDSFKSNADNAFVALPPSDGARTFANVTQCDNCANTTVNRQFVSSSRPPLWQTQIPISDAYLQAVSPGGDMLFYSDLNKLAMVEAGGRVPWLIDDFWGFWVSAFTTGASGREVIVVGDDDNGVGALDRRTGQLLWRKKETKAFMMRVGEGLALVTTAPQESHSSLVALDVETGAVVWTMPHSLALGLPTVLGLVVSAPQWTALLSHPRSLNSTVWNVSTGTNLHSCCGGGAVLATASEACLTVNNRSDLGGVRLHMVTCLRLQDGAPSLNHSLPSPSLGSDMFIPYNDSSLFLITTTQRSGDGGLENVGYMVNSSAHWDPAPRDSGKIFSIRKIMPR